MECCTGRSSINEEIQRSSQIGGVLDHDGRLNDSRFQPIQDSTHLEPHRMTPKKFDSTHCIGNLFCN